MGISVANTLFNRGNKIIREGEIGDIEIRFYSSETPNEKFRIGQKALTGKVTTITKVSNGYKFSFDISKKYFGEVNSFSITKDYIESCYIRCIVFDITNTINDEQDFRTYTISADEWLSNNTYLNEAIIDTSSEKWVYEENQYVIVKATNANGDIEGTARIVSIENTGDIDEDGLAIFKITFDFSDTYSYRIETIESFNIESIEKFIPPSDKDENWDGES